MTVKVVLWRHGRTDWNEAGRFQGHTDIGLNETGREQAARAALLLASLKPDVIVSSDLSRARDTAQALASLTGQTVSTDPGLRETNGGLFEGMHDREIPLLYPDEYEVWRRGDVDTPVGLTGESRRQVAERTAAAVTRVAQALPDGGLAVVALHGGCARLAVATLIGLPLEKVQNLGLFGNCAWSMLSHGERGWRLDEYNAGTLPEPVDMVEG